MKSLPYFERPLFFFDQSRFRKDLNEKPLIPTFKDALNAGNVQFDLRFREGEEIRNLIYERAQFVDCLLHYAWHQFDWQGNINLLAVGGYGRGELHPKSDIDLLILLDKDSTGSSNTSAIEQFLTLLWDIGLEIGHSVRTIEQCVDIARGDRSVATNMMECRTLIGCEEQRVKLMRATSSDKLWPADEFFRTKWDEQQSRHQQHNNTEYNLEPNIKNAPGGLRDIQMISWVAKRFFGVRTLKQLQGSGFFSEEEFAILLSSEECLWKVRYGLHMIAGRAEERLLFHHQRELAEIFGYTDNEESLAVEQFMHWYYRTVLALRELNDVLLQFLSEAILRQGLEKTATPINERFQLRGDFIEVTLTKVFEDSPSALIEIFTLMAQNPDIKGVRASTIRLIREHRYLINDEFRADTNNSALFMQLFQHPETLGKQLKCMRRYGILGRYLPEFGQITGQMQHDLFHIYTVDAHTLHVVQNMCNFHKPESQEKFPIASHVIKRLSMPNLLYIAGLYHDIAKGRGGDHSTLGAIDAELFCQRHQVSPRATRLICWLVENHLLMSQVSQKQDLSDPDVIHDFAKHMGDQLHLDYLYAMTVADICATNPDLWSTWRASLMRQLYLETKRALRRGLGNPVDKSDLIDETQDAAIAKLEHKGFDKPQILSVWGDLGDDYFLRESHNDIAWHTEAIATHNCDAPLVLVRETSEHEFEGATQIFIRTKEQHNVFAAAASALDALNLNIQDARIYNSRDGYTIDTFFVLDQDGQSIGHDEHYIQHLRSTLINELSLVADYPTQIGRRTPRQLKHFAMPTQTTLCHDEANSYSILEVITPDRAGLLARIGEIFLKYKVQLLNARISTLGERVEDIFFITDEHDQPLSDETIAQALQQDICQQLDQRVDKE